MIRICPPPLPANFDELPEASIGRVGADGSRAVRTLRERGAITTEDDVKRQVAQLRRSGEVFAWRRWMPFNV